MYFAATRCASLLSDKYDITKHPNYKYLSPTSTRVNAFDVERYISVRQSDEAFDKLYSEIDLSDEDTAEE